MLRSLELFGFKSFADRTVFEFSSGITGVVGPNGSGKSNVVDSIKWILGDQSARSLRGKEMTDVIFNGSSSRGGAQFAEATLVFDNRSRFLPLDLDEVAVGRRLWQSGDSEYLINRTTARLRDVRELFLGTGAGTASYCIIEQGRVDQILQSNAANRRLIFEEAAGISRLRNRRTEALRRLERVEQNLVRLADIVDEVETQVTSLRTQAQRAARYREVSTELQALWIGLAADDFRRESLRQERLRQDMELAEERLKEYRARLTQTQQRLDGADAQLNEVDDRLRAVERLAGDRRSRIASLQTTREHLSARHAELLTELGRLTRQSRLMTTRVSEAESERTALDEAVADVQQAVIEKQEQLSRCDHELTEMQSNCRDTRSAIEESRRTLLQQVQQNSENSSALAACEAQLTEQQQRKAVAAAELYRTDEHVAELQTRLVTAQQTLQSAGQAVSDAEDHADQLLQSRQEIVSQQSQSQQSLSALREHRSALLARKTILEDLEDRQEGLGIGVREILRRAEESAGEPWNQIEGTVADLLDADLDNAALLEVALSGRSQLLVIRRMQPLIEYLRSGRSRISGRVGFVALEGHGQPPLDTPATSPSWGNGDAAQTGVNTSDPNAPELKERLWDAAEVGGIDLPSADSSGFGRPLLVPGELRVNWIDSRSSSPVVRSVFHQRRADPSPLFGARGVIGRADGLARSPGHLPGLAALLLADTWIVESLGDALRLHAESEGVWRFVTLQGELLDHAATLYAGSIRPESAVMSRKSELRRLRNELTRTEHEISEREFALSSLADSLQQADASLAAAREAVADAYRRHRDAELACAEAQRNAENAARLLTDLRMQQETITVQIRAILLQMETLTATRRERVVRLEELQQQIREQEAGLSDKQGRLDVLERTRMTANIDLSRTEERLVSLREAITRQDEELEQRRLQRVEAVRRTRAAQLQLQDLQLRQLNVHSEVSELQLETDALQDQVRNLAAHRQQLRQQRSETMQAVTSIQNQCREQEAAHHERDLQLRGIIHELKSVADRIREEYQIEVQQAVDRGDSALAIWLHRGEAGSAVADTEQEGSVEPVAAVESGAPDELPRYNDDVAAILPNDDEYQPIRARIEQQVERLRRRLRNIGHVSVDSIESLTELETRFERLHGQLSDLEAARDALREIVRRINSESRRLFLESFESVRGHFRDLFRKLFGGGEADLILEDPDEVLECAIDVVARPPGKELRSISLLSGGEKTLTAVALLLAIFRSRPSPYCILDEVDAALDDANIGRFVGVLRDFQQSTQFILITHRKPTMAVTDVLYGVTMEESGVSRRLSLRFEDVDEQGNFIAGSDRPSRAA